MNDFYTIDHLPGRTILLDGREFLFFSGTSYLGIAQNPAFQALLAESLGRYGTMFGSSRNGNLRLGVYEEAEARLAAFAGAPAALTLSSGMMAGQVVVNWLRGQGYRFLYAPHTHPALWQQPVEALPTATFDEWATRLPERVASAHSEKLVIALNSLDAVRSVGYSFEWVRDLPADQEITLLVDDSHGLGVAGPEGSGIGSLIPHRPDVRLIVTASLAKAMGLPGGVVFAEPSVLKAIRETPFFGACSPIAPAYLDAFGRSGDLYAHAFRKLRQTVRRFEEIVGNRGPFQHIPEYPVFYTPQDELYSFLLTKRILIYSFAYPSPTDKPNTRIVLSALHQPEDLETLADCLYEKRFL
ncbi:aminotransferase class I/II-fold pyridoxal phosphate-dependent enzyme [Larkinella soli]|uniref:aminotransferase class I/II-fold pyridoxal phosphate-dependent enzyme n=1 Tax=Larkinella soli TaxID=1770527 RepID=UPI000FFB9A32|nr:aminotransferase class I/II-fold pyridoxal phosphate-dependent enzyme [Larkinella soli]